MSQDHRPTPQAPRRPEKPVRAPGAADVRARAEELVRTSGILLPQALQVVRGERSLNDVVSGLALRAEVDALVVRHGLSRALATQVARKEADLEEVLRKARMAAHLLEHRDHSVLHDALTSGQPIALAVHGVAVVRGRVVGLDPYEVVLNAEDGVEHRIHKLQLKYAYDPVHYKVLRKALRYDSARKGAHEPVSRPQDRYGCSDKRLFRYLDTKAPIAATTLEGEVLNGRVTWMGRWEFCLKLDKGDGWVVVFRHALADIGEAR